MGLSQCSGQDRRFWKPEDIHIVACHICGSEVELWKDEGRRKCRNCGAEGRNPRVESGCAAWCAFADDCVGALGADTPDAEKKNGSTAVKLTETLTARYSFTPDEVKALESLAEEIGGLELPEGFSPFVFTVEALMLAACTLRTSGDTDLRQAGAAWWEQGGRETLDELGMDPAAVRRIFSLFETLTEGAGRGETGPQPLPACDPDEELKASLNRLAFFRQHGITF
ncbi:MAG: hypothetical protein E4H36_14970 [Spirochaetales bacterium]|nr:MAG: hypothetical protein E4H36_14970 [Spirochaetales bacterium]